MRKFEVLAGHENYRLSNFLNYNSLEIICKLQDKFQTISVRDLKIIQIWNIEDFIAVGRPGLAFPYQANEIYFDKWINNIRILQL